MYIFNRAMRFLFLIACLILIVNARAGALIDSVDPAIQKAVINYLEKEYPRRSGRPGGETFVYCNFLGMERESGGRISVFSGCCSMNTFRLQYGQVFLWSGAGVPAVIRVLEKNGGYQVEKVDEAMEGELYGPSLKRLFPEKYQSKLQGSNPKTDSARMDCKQRVLDYYRPLLPANRFARVKPPSDRNDPHNHNEPIYDYLNLREVSEYVSITSVPDHVVNTLVPEESPELSPNGNFKVWRTSDHRGFHLFFKQVRKQKVFEIVNKTNLMYLNYKWKGKTALVVDQINGVNFFDSNPGVHPERHGVHFEIDLDKRSIEWAVPFGWLGYSEKTAAVPPPAEAEAFKAGSP